MSARLARWHALAGTARGKGAERAANEAWLLLEACAGAFATATLPAPGVRLFDELSLRDAVARAARAHGAESEAAWRLAARVRALLAHPEPGRDATTWRALLADDDARYAAGLAEDADAAEAPGWLSLPSRLTAPATPRA